MTTEPQEQQKTPEKPKAVGITAETRAMAAAYNAISKLDRDAQVRVLDWLNQRLSNEEFRRNQQRGRCDYDEEPPF